MLRLITSLSFLYALTIIILIVYGWIYYRDFTRSAWHRKRFPIVFFIIGVACFVFLWVNIHAPLRLKTFSNLDHYFIRNDGFVVNKSIELGRSDTVNFDNNSFNSFVLSRKEKLVTLSSGYSEEPFYALDNGKFRLRSASWPATGHAISFKASLLLVAVKTLADDSFELSLNGQVYKISKQVKKGINCWNLFKDEPAFLGSAHYNDEILVNNLRNVLVVRDDVSKKEGGDLKYFVSGRLFQSTEEITYDHQKLRPNDLKFAAAIPDKTLFAWGIGFLGNNKNQFRLHYMMGSDSFLVENRYPVSYPLTQENNTDWSEREVTKFLVSGSKDMLNLPPVFGEGFLFSVFPRDSSMDFLPTLLSYRKGSENKSPALTLQPLNKQPTSFDIVGNKFLLPARSKQFSWQFSIQNTFDWNFTSGMFAPAVWQGLVFGSLLLFFACVLLTSLVTSSEKLSWVWQLLSSITLVLITTRFFLYWRYKSFPPYEGMDLPSQQQLNSFWNFGIILLATIVLGLIFGFGFLKYAGSIIQKRVSSILKSSPKAAHFRFSLRKKINDSVGRLALVEKAGTRAAFCISWICLLIGSAGIAYANHFDPGACRHLAIGLMVAYFIYVFISYRHSPLLSNKNKSWWAINTNRKLDMMISNPVKVLLSVSLLAVFVFIDIGFAIVFLNFLLFNEAFLCINYAIAGLSAGSQRNATWFGILGSLYLMAFILNLLYAPYIFQWVLGLSQSIYLVGYAFFSLVIAYSLVRLLGRFAKRERIISGFATAVFLFAAAYFFFPKEKILDKASMTKYRVAVLTMPVEKAIEEAYQEGKTYEPVIRAAQNQWFINTLIYEKNNPDIANVGFHLLPHAPQNKGAKYNAQATDLVASRFFLAEHGTWSVLLYVLLLLLPTSMLASFYKLYPDFTNRTNTDYPTITAGFSILNYFLISALLVILAATGRYIFFGQDMPFGSILSKQSILFPSILIVVTVVLFRHIPLEYYANRKKFIPGLILFSIVGILLFLVQPVFNKNKEFNADGLASDMDSFIQLRLQPLMEHFDTSAGTSKYSIEKKDRLFTDSVRSLIASGAFKSDNIFFDKEIEGYSRLDFSGHLDQTHLLYLDIYSGRPQLAINANYFRIEPPPHLQQSWTGNVFGDSTIYNVSLWDSKKKSVTRKRVSDFTNDPHIQLNAELSLSFNSPINENNYKDLYLINKSHSVMTIMFNDENTSLGYGDSIKLRNPWKATIVNSTGEKIITIQPDAFMRNYYVNGSRSYVYPMSERFIWARNFAESIASEYTSARQMTDNATISFDYEMMDSLSWKLRKMMNRDTAYKKDAEYGICVADGNGRLMAMADFVKGLARPDPNDKAGFNKTITGENGYVPQSLLRKQIGNINLLRMNPGPGSTFKPIAFSAIASQLNMDWDAFATEGFSTQQKYFGGERVAGYDFEKNNGRIASVADYLKYSDNYYYSNVLLLGSYPKQALDHLLDSKFLQHNPDSSFHWPWFNYKGKEFWLDGFKNWPGYLNGEANFGLDSSFTSIGLLDNYGIYNHTIDQSFDQFSCCYDSSLFLNAFKRSGFILPEYALFDQQGANVNKHIPYDLFATCFRGHVKGSSQVLVPPVKMVDAFGKLVTQSRNYSLTLNPYALPEPFEPFAVDNTIVYNNYLTLIREGVFKGMKEVLNSGTAGTLGLLLKKRSAYYYYAKTGTTGDNESKLKSKLLAIVISKKDISEPGFNFRNNKFYTIYFTSQNGPAKQNEQFQDEIIRYIEQSASFNKYMN